MAFLVRKPKVIFTIKLANTVIEVHALYKRTMKFCHDYLTNESPEISVYVDKSDILNERRLTNKQMKQEGHRLFYFIDKYYEPSALCRKIMSELIK